MTWVSEKQQTPFCVLMVVEWKSAVARFPLNQFSLCNACMCVSSENAQIALQRPYRVLKTVLPAS